MSAFVDRTGQRFGRLVVLRRDTQSAGRVRFICLCDCGVERSLLASCLTSGQLSCGCLGDEQRARKGKNMTHGKSKTRVYEIWSSMKKRCLNRSNHAWQRYGGRGITVCDRWMTFENFLSDMGEPPEDMSIERLHNDRGYEPGNCIWADDTTQARNRRNARTVDLDGEKIPLIVAADRLGVPYATAYYRFFVSPVTGVSSNVEQLSWD